jgi:translation initiation factor 3 subunit B
MMDKAARDQFVIRFGNNTSVMWNDGRRGRAEDAYSRANWTESYVQWSPLGDMLATVHRQGVAVWGGPQFKRLNRFEHHNVQLIEFSPCETYLFAYSSIEPSNPREKLTIKLDVFDVRAGGWMGCW